MDRKIYHGSSRIIRKPGFGEGRQYNDFGLGFYCSEQARYAAEWAVGRGRSGFVSSYAINTDGLRVINLCGPQYTVLHWLNILFNYREFDMSSDTAHRGREYINYYFTLDYQGVDCIIGWRSDNRCFKFAQDFLDGSISYQSLRKVLASDDSNRQFVLKSNRAFDRVSFTGYEPALYSDHFPVKTSRELSSLRSARTSVSAGDLFITDLIREEVRPYDTRL